MTVAEFRKIALSLPGSEERSHQGHPDFRVGGKIFATLFRRDDRDWGMVKLDPAEQRRFVEEHPDTYDLIQGAWGRGGATRVDLSRVGRSILRKAMLAAWLNVAPKKLKEEWEAQS